MKKMIFLFVLILSAGSASAQPGVPAARTLRSGVEQPPVDARFAGWLGCWRLDDDLSGTGARMCITPENSGVRLQTIVGTNKGIDEVVIADGVSRPIADAECKGNEQAEWSQDGARVFRTTNVTCGKEAPRTIKTVAFLAPGPAWVMVQHVTGESATANLRVQRYRRAANQNLADGSRAPQPDATTASRITAEQAHWSIEDVIEASGKLPIEAIQASLTELHHGFDLNRKTLVALDEGGVDRSVIDLMVALTYPKKFVVERAGGGSAPMGISTGTGWFDPFLPAEYAMSYGSCYTPYGYGYRSYYSMCGPGFYAPYSYSYYGYGSPYYPYYGNGSDWIGIGGTPPAIGNVEPQPQGRVVNGHGYTQVRDRQPEPSPRISGNGNGGGWNGSGGGSGVSSSGYSSGSSSSGSSGGSGGGDSGARVAVPKGGGL